MYHGPAPEEGPVCYRHQNRSTVISPTPSPPRCGSSKSLISHATLHTWAHASSCCLFCFPAIITLLSFCWSLYPGPDSLSACDPVSVLLMYSLFGLWQSFYSTREEEKGEKKKVKQETMSHNCRVKFSLTYAHRTFPAEVQHQCDKSTLKVMKVPKKSVTESQNLQIMSSVERTRHVTILCDTICYESINRCARHEWNRKCLSITDFSVYISVIQMHYFFYVFVCVCVC